MTRAIFSDYNDFSDEFYSSDYEMTSLRPTKQKQLLDVNELLKEQTKTILIIGETVILKYSFVSNLNRLSSASLAGSELRFLLLLDSILLDKDSPL